MRAHLPKDQPRSRAKGSLPVVSSTDGGNVDMHATEAAMLADIGLFRNSGAAIAGSRRPGLMTVEALLKEHQKKEERGGSRSGSEVSESELMASMTARLSSLERVSSQQAQLMREKDESIRSLKAQVSILEQNASATDAMAQLEEENMRLKRQIHEMETFLNDYGLVWAGFRADLPDDVFATRGADSSITATTTGNGSSDEHKAENVKTEIYFDIKQAMLSLKDLNHLAGEGHMKIVAERGVAKFQPPEAVPLIFYKNGIFFKNGPLRPYSMPECQAFVKDILEGYFPYELKSQYPDGVVFAAADRSTEIHGAPQPTKFQAFGGAGNRLVSSSSPSLPSPMTAEQFLNKLPNAVVSNGKVIEVRSDIGRLLNAGDRMAASNNSLKLVRTPIIEQMERTDGRPSTPGDIATLRIQSDDGAPALLIKLRFHDSISTLRSYIDSERKSLDKSLTLTYDLRTNFPSKVYNINSQTLQEAGLTPNATLLLRTKSAPPTATAAAAAAPVSSTTLTSSSSSNSSNSSSISGSGIAKTLLSGK